MMAFFIDKSSVCFLRFDWQVFSILSQTEDFFSSVNLFPTTRLSRGFRYTKSATTEVAAQKMQTPIVAKLINIKHHSIHTEGICIFIKFMVRTQKGIIPPCDAFHNLISLARLWYHICAEDSRHSVKYYSFHSKKAHPARFLRQDVLLCLLFGKGKCSLTSSHRCRSRR